MTAGGDRRADTLATLASRLAEAKAAIADSPFSRWANALGGALVPSVRLHALVAATSGGGRFGGGDGGRLYFLVDEADLRKGVVDSCVVTSDGSGYP